MCVPCRDAGPTPYVEYRSKVVSQVKEGNARVDAYPMDRRSQMRRIARWWGRMCPVASILLAAALAAGLGHAPADAASSAGTIVGAEVLTAVTVDATACASGVAGRTDFGALLPGVATVTTSDCTVGFGSSNSATQLRLRQEDGAGVAMWQENRGTLDTGFSGDGMLAEPFVAGATTMTTAEAVVVQPDGAIVIASACDSGGGTGIDACVVRLLPSGARDGSFGSGGLAMFPFVPGAVVDAVTSVALQSDGKILVGGSCTGAAATNMDFCLARLLVDGTLDTSFAGTGSMRPVVVAGAYDEQVDELVVSRNGAIVAAGTCGSAPAAFCAARFTSSGTIDTAYGTNGVTTVRLTTGTADNRVSAAVEQPDGRLVLAGSCEDSAGTTMTDACVLRLTINGLPDTTFSGDGHIVIATVPGTEPDLAADVDLLSGGSILTTGSCSVAGVGGNCYVRLTSTGIPDASFGTGGIVRNVVTPNFSVGRSTAVVGSRITTAAWCLDAALTNIETCVSRHLLDGSFDTTFGGGTGWMRLSLAPAAGNEYGNVVAAGPDGSFVVGSSCEVAGNGNDTCIARFAGGSTVSQYTPTTADWSSVGTSHFAACLHGTVNAAPTWTPNGSCAVGNGAWWNAVPTTATIIASATSGETGASASLRFGLRTRADQSPGRYVAPIVFDAIAP
ncbi:MAG: hypothetical protein JWM25_697 [Thermoleophilia bacterium]|nr:hypothetical protein [Thermoleophilia bacterium]